MSVQECSVSLAPVDSIPTSSPDNTPRLGLPGQHQTAKLTYLTVDLCCQLVLPGQWGSLVQVVPPSLQEIPPH
ncbi:MAG: hypothetical protein FRX49_10732 [Trebouxia sp. A1-2]|nr:MAG: hypothetical protein FRX49_10732 [Trebouxia sp. A1-2]